MADSTRALSIRSFVNTLAAAMFLASAAIVAAPAAARAATHPTLQTNAVVGSYLVSIWNDPRGCGGAYFVIERGGKRVFTSLPHCDASVSIGALHPDDPDAILITPGTDVTGTGTPDLVMTTFSGEAHCCLSYYIFRLGDNFRLIDIISALNDDPATRHFVRLEPGGGLQIVLHDWTFAGWHTSFARSPAPLVILHYRGKHFVPAPDLMAEQPPSEHDMQLDIGRVRWKLLLAGENSGWPAWPDVKLPPDLWGTMLDLIYTGHEQLAWQFLDRAWPVNVHGKTRFLADFKRQLATSPYWTAIGEFNSSSDHGGVARPHPVSTISRTAASAAAPASAGAVPAARPAVSRSSL
jgi:hypothetical protein